ncbi:MAG TPA: universal stress protein [Polyangiaceae bacterium]|jgi:nucleotide-binding universal stress UspA family protein|nr:universal stress protein [Polyangiaceae bacterium]
MLSMRKILVPIDLSPAGMHVLQQAQEFAAKFSGTIDLLYVWTPPALQAPEAMLTGVGAAELPLLEWLRNNAQEQLSKFVSQAESAGYAIAQSYCDLGDPTTTIIERAGSGGYDLLVMGTHGRTGLSHALMGSVAEKVVRRAPCAVLTVRTADARAGH